MRNILAIIALALFASFAHADELTDKTAALKAEIATMQEQLKAAKAAQKAVKLAEKLQKLQDKRDGLALKLAEIAITAAK